MQLHRALLVIAFGTSWAVTGQAQITIAVGATDAGSATTTRVESRIPNPFGPAATNIVANPSGAAPMSAYSFAEIDLISGNLRLRVDDSTDLLNPGALSASANLNALGLRNTSPVDLSLDANAFNITFDAEHLVDGTPTNVGAGTGEKNAFVNYVLTMQLTNTSAGQSLGQIVAQSRMDVTWNADGSFKERVLSQPAPVTQGGFAAVTNVFDETTLDVSLETPALVWSAGDTWNWRVGLNVFADADDPGIMSVVNALSTGSLNLTLPEGIELVQTAPGIINGLEDLEFVSVVPVPVPAAVWLFGSALGLLGWVRLNKVGALPQQNPYV